MLVYIGQYPRLWEVCMIFELILFINSGLSLYDLSSEVAYPLIFQ